jgi:hypothetical protein
MKVRTVLAAAGLSLAVASFSPPVFAQVGGVGAGGSAGGVASAVGGAPAGFGAAGVPGGLGVGGSAVSAGMPVANGISGIFGQAPSAGQPGTQAPASAAPIGTSTSDWMSAEGGSIADQSPLIPGPQDTELEKQLRTRETTLERDIGAYRAYSYNVQPAAWEKWLGSECLARGDRVDAAKHFQNAATDLRQLSEAGPYALRSNHPDSTLHGNQTSEIMNAANMHSNRSSSSVY